MKKYIYCLIIFLVLLFPSIVFGISIIDKPLSSFLIPTTNFYVNDYANILSSETEEYIVSKSQRLYDVDGTQIVVVTVPNLGENTLEDYANELFNFWKIGDKEKNNGLLLLLALEEREFRVEVGEGLEGILPDGKTGRFQDQYIIPYLRDSNWDEGIKNGYDAFYSEIVRLNNLDLDYKTPDTIDGSDTVKFTSIFALMGTLFGSIGVVGCVVSIFLGLFIKNMKDKKKQSRLTKLYFCILVIMFAITVLWFSNLVIMVFMNLILFVMARFGQSSSFGRSSFGGFSSSRSSSSRFSGGGGRSSGGGSSRRF